MRTIQKEAKQLLNHIKTKGIEEINQLKEQKNFLEIARAMVQILSDSGEDPTDSYENKPNFLIFEKLVKEAVKTNNLVLAETLLTSVKSFTWVTCLSEENIQLTVKNNQYKMLKLLLLQGVPVYRYAYVKRPSITQFLIACENPGASKAIISLLIEYGVELDGIPIRALTSTKKEKLEVGKFYIRELKNSIEYASKDFLGSVITGEISRNQLPHGVPQPFETSEIKMMDIEKIISAHYDNTLNNNLRLGNRTVLEQKNPLEIFNKLTTTKNNPTLILHILFIPVISNLIAEYWIENHQEILNILAYYNVHLLKPLQTFFTPFITLPFISAEKAPELKQLVQKIDACHSTRKDCYLITPKAIDEKIKYQVTKLLARDYKFIPGSAQYRQIAGFLEDGVIEKLAAEVKRDKASGSKNTEWSFFTKSPEEKSTLSLFQTALMDVIHFVKDLAKNPDVDHRIETLYREGTVLLTHPDILTIPSNDNFRRIERFKNQINQALEKFHNNDSVAKTLLQLKNHLVELMGTMHNALGDNFRCIPPKI